MAKKFSISEDMLSSISKNTEKVNTLEAKDSFKIEYIDIDKIIRNEKNFYEITDIDELAEDILLNGLNHNLVVKKVENNLYKLISGERRYTALKNLVKSGESKFKYVPCKISNLNEVDSEIILIQSNAQSRELSEVEKLKQVQRLTELYSIKKKNGETVGRIRNLISKDTGLSPTQIGRYSSINNNLIPELRELLNEGELSVANASEFSTLSEENQNIILNIVNNKVRISKNEAAELKKQFKEIEKENERLKIELNKMKSDKSKLLLNHELRVMLKNIRKEITKVTGLLVDNKIIDEETLKEVNNLKLELRFLNEQTDLYINQSKF